MESQSNKIDDESSSENMDLSDNKKEKWTMVQKILKQEN